jgi:hypothetical protein
LAKDPKRPPNGPHVTAETEKEAAVRRDRLAAELRANLARRKAQSRARADDDKPPGDGGATP